jgi:peptidoglycan L-alanyl-D-glutamate endopeptidase CwlK
MVLTERCLTLVEVYPPHKTLSEQRLEKVHPALSARVCAMMERLAQSKVSILITQGLRTWEEQDALFAKGRTTPPIGHEHIVTNAKGGQSYHNFGLAVDIVLLDALGKPNWDTEHAGWREAARVGKSLGLEWGGDWSAFPDIPHYQYTNHLPLALCRELFAGGGLERVWEEVR